MVAGNDNTEIVLIEKKCSRKSFVSIYWFTSKSPRVDLTQVAAPYSFNGFNDSSREVNLIERESMAMERVT